VNARAASNLALLVLLLTCRFVLLNLLAIAENLFLQLSHLLLAAAEKRVSAVAADAASCRRCAPVLS
jgi:hypothetical protein